MAGDWNSVQLGMLAANLKGAVAIGPFGSAMKADVYVSAGVPVIRGTNITSDRRLAGDWVYITESFANTMPRCVVRENDIVFPHRGSIGEVALVPADQHRYFLSTSMMKITLDQRKADPRFVTYYFRSEPGRREIMRFASQVGTPGIGQPLSSLRQFALPAPPVEVQRAVADLLSTLDDKIELNRRMAETLEAIARALFKSWFADFDPVHARAEGRPTGLPENLAALFPDSFGENGLPKEWERKALQTGLAHSVMRGISPSYSPQGVLVLNQRCIRDSRVDMSKARHHDAVLRRVGEERLLAPGDVVINSTGVGTLGRVAQVRRPPEPITADSHVTIVKPNRTLISPDLFGLALIYLEPLIETLGRGSTGQTELSRDSVGELQIVIASQQVRRAFDDAVTPLRDRADLAWAEALTLEQLRDTLLPKLISGELRINEAEEKVSAA